MKTSIDLEKLADHFDRDNELFQELVKTFCDIYQEQIKELKKFKQESNFKEFERIAHSIKGGVSNFFAEDVREQAFELEKMGKSNQLPDSVDSMIDGLSGRLDELASDLNQIDLSKI